MGKIKIKNCRRDKLRFNLMVVGESGQGKTTFLHTLLSRYVDEVAIVDVENIEKTVNISEVGRFEAISEDDGLDVVLYDTPGYGDFINNQDAIDKIREYLIECHYKWRNLDAQSMTEAEFLMADDRIHCVFYFIASHRMKDIDTEFIRQLSPLVPIIPIIAKADTMTVQERNNHILTVYQKLDDLSKKIKEDCIYDFGSNQPCSVTGNTEPDISSFISVGNALMNVRSTSVDSSEVSFEGGGQTDTQLLSPRRVSQSTPSLPMQCSTFDSSRFLDNYSGISLPPDIQRSSSRDNSFEVAVDSSGKVMSQAHAIAQFPPAVTYIANVESENVSPSGQIIPTASDESRDVNKATQSNKVASIKIIRLSNIFAVVCDVSNERVYPWGTLKIDDMTHSDFRRLQILLFENDYHITNLIARTRAKSIGLFKRDRRNNIGNVRNSSPVTALATSNENVNLQNSRTSPTPQRRTRIMRNIARFFKNNSIIITVVAGVVIAFWFRLNILRYRRNHLQSNTSMLYTSAAMNETKSDNCGDGDEHMASATQNDQKGSNVAFESLSYKKPHYMKASGTASSDIFDLQDEYQFAMNIGDLDPDVRNSGIRTTCFQGIHALRDLRFVYSDQKRIIFVRQGNWIHLTPIWYKYESNRWSWTPYSNIENKSIWTPITSLRALSGKYAGYSPHYKNVDIITFLKDNGDIICERPCLPLHLVHGCNQMSLTPSGFETGVTFTSDYDVSGDDQIFDNSEYVYNDKVISGTRVQNEKVKVVESDNEDSKVFDLLQAQ